MSQVLAETQLPMQPAMFAITAIGFFVVLLAITWAFRNANNKHR